MIIDPRIHLIKERIEGISNIIPVISSKGGVGKSLISTALAWHMKDMARTGLLDLDVWGASDHLLLALSDRLNKFPDEERGIVPVNVNGLNFMSVVFYTGNRPLPLRGDGFSEVFLELVSITRWDKLDFLFIDMPPGLNDPILDVLKYFKKGKFLVVATPSKLAVNVVNNTLDLILSQGYSIIGIVENMSRGNSSYLESLTEKYDIEIIGRIPYIEEIEEEIDSLQSLMNGRFFRETKKIADRIFHLF